MSDACSGAVGMERKRREGERRAAHAIHAWTHVQTDARLDDGLGFLRIIAGFAGIVNTIDGVGRQENQ